MYLKTLSQEAKDNFLSLAYQIARVDGDYDDEERKVIENYKLEMGLEYARKGKTIDNLVDYFKDRDANVKKIVYYESYRLITSDGRLDQKEQEVLNLIEDKFGLNNDIYKDIKEVVEEMVNLTGKISGLIA